MAPKPRLENKRKRGVPPTASKRDPDALQPSHPEVNDADADADADDAERPKKRGRLPRSASARTAAAEGTAPTENDYTPPKRATRHTLREGPVGAGEVTAQDGKRKRRPGRPAPGTSAAGLESPKVKGALRTRVQKGAQETIASRAVPAEGEPPRKRRGRNPVEAQPEPEPEPEQPSRPRRGRISRKDHQEQEQMEEREEQNSRQRFRKRGELPSPQEPSAPAPRSKRPKSAGKHPTSKPRADAEPERSKRKRQTRSKEASQEKPKPRGRRAAQPAPKSTQEKPRGGDDDDDDDAAALPPSPEKQYTHIAPRVHRVRQSTIKAKWTPLGDPSRAAVSSILHLAHRPILQRLSNTQQRRDHASSALRLITSRITRKIAKGLPFPPPAMPGRTSLRGERGATADSGRAAELDFESVLDAKHALERQLDPALHAVELLRREKEKLARELDTDYEVLRNLEASARSKGREYRALMKKAHVLAPAPENLARRGDAHDKDSLVFSPAAASASKGLFDDLQPEEEDIKALGLQLGSHLDSIQNNLRQTEGIAPQISRSRAALQDVLFRYLDPEQYEHVLLG